jgi:hypothetical protein
MKLMLNELSMHPSLSSKHEAAAVFDTFSRTAGMAYRQGIKKIQSDLSTDKITLFDNYSLYNWLFDKEFEKKNRTYRDFLSGMITLPFLDEDKEDDYYSANYFFEDTENNIQKTKCLGLAAAYIENSLSIGFSNGPAWGRNTLKIIVEKDKNTINTLILNVYSEKCFYVSEISDAVAERINVDLLTTDIPAIEKICHLAHHHGIDDLRNLWEKLRNNPYIISARSTEWGGDKIIRKVTGDGLIEVVLVKTDKKYALQIQSTGRNLHETRRIACIIESRLNNN